MKSYAALTQYGSNIAGYLNADIDASSVTSSDDIVLVRLISNSQAQLRDIKEE